MAAETLTATRAASTFPVYTGLGAGNLNVAYGTYAVAANVEDGDIFEMCRLPAGARVLGGFLFAGDMDTGTEALDMDIGWAANGGTGTYDSADPDGLGNLGVWTGDAFATGNLWGIAGNCFAFAGILATGVFPHFTKETVIQVEANAAAATFAAKSMSVVVLYVVDQTLL